MGKIEMIKAAAEQMNITEDYMNGYMKGKMDAKADSEEVIVELKEEIRQLKRERDELREKYDINYLQAGGYRGDYGRRSCGTDLGGHGWILGYDLCRRQGR